MVVSKKKKSTDERKWKSGKEVKSTRVVVRVWLGRDIAITLAHLCSTQLRLKSATYFSTRHMLQERSHASTSLYPAESTFISLVLCVLRHFFSLLISAPSFMSRDSNFPRTGDVLKNKAARRRCNHWFWFLVLAEIVRTTREETSYACEDKQWVLTLFKRDSKLLRWI